MEGGGGGVRGGGDGGGGRAEGGEAVEVGLGGHLRPFTSLFSMERKKSKVMETQPQLPKKARQ